MSEKLLIEVKGEVVQSNLPQYILSIEKKLSQIKTNLVSEEDFAFAKEVVKRLRARREEIKIKKEEVLKQMQKVSDLLNSFTKVDDLFRNKASFLEKKIKNEELSRKKEIINKNLEKLFIDEIDKKILGEEFSEEAFFKKIKGKKTLASIVDTIRDYANDLYILRDNLRARYKANLEIRKLNELNNIIPDSDLILPFEEFKEKCNQIKLEQERKEKAAEDRVRQRIEEQARIEAERKLNQPTKPKEIINEEKEKKPEQKNNSAMEKEVGNTPQKRSTTEEKYYIKAIIRFESKYLEGFKKNLENSKIFEIIKLEKIEY